MNLALQGLRGEER